MTCGIFIAIDDVVYIVINSRVGSIMFANSIRSAGICIPLDMHPPLARVASAMRFAICKNMCVYKICETVFTHCIRYMVEIYFFFISCKIYLKITRTHKLNLNT